MANLGLEKRLTAWAKRSGEFDTPFGLVKLGSQLGRGANAFVFEAASMNGVAVKLLVEDVSGEPTERYLRFRSEYLNLVRLVPTGLIVPLYQFGNVQLDGVTVPFILMERCITTLWQQHRRNPLRDPAAFEELANRLLTILDTIHKAGIIHRDLKPHNVLQRPNGKWVLGDFGIAWFDPEQYLRDFQTERHDRLGNFAFAAPEQVRRDMGDPRPSMDYYALGQVLYWAVTGTTVRGTSHASLRSIAVDLGRFDPLVNALLRQEPSSRPPSVAAIRELLRPRALPDRYKERFRLLIRQQNLFDEALRRGLPGVNGSIQVAESQVDRVLGTVAEVCDDANLFVHFSSGEVSACPMRKDSGEWVFGSLEAPIEEVWLHRSSIIERQFLLVRLRPHEPFPVHGLRARGARDEAGLFEGRYIRRGEFDDGYAELDGEVVQTSDNAELRVRYMRPTIVALAPSLSVVGCPDNDPERKSLFLEAEHTETISLETVEAVGHMNRPSWMTPYD